MVILICALDLNIDSALFYDKNGYFIILWGSVNSYMDLKFNHKSANAAETLNGHWHFFHRRREVTDHERASRRQPRNFWGLSIMGYSQFR